MKRGFAAFVLVGLVALACADAAQAGLIFRRGRSNDCCCNDNGYYGYSGGGYRGGYYAYGGPTYYGGGYASNCGCQSGGYVMYGGYGMPMTTGSPSTSMYGGSEPIMAGRRQVRHQQKGLKVTGSHHAPPL